jgi:hypothetical protein
MELGQDVRAGVIELQEAVHHQGHADRDDEAPELQARPNDPTQHRHDLPG